MSGLKFDLHEVIAASDFEGFGVIIGIVAMPGKKAQYLVSHKSPRGSAICQNWYSDADLFKTKYGNGPVIAAPEVSPPLSELPDSNHPTDETIESLHIDQLRLKNALLRHKLDELRA